jgi:large subunit ribosomal protein L23
MNTYSDILRRPVVTEKSSHLSTKLHQYVFEVSKNATRTMVKDAVERMFEVTVLKVNILNSPPKRKRNPRSRRFVVRSPQYKKAIVTLSPEDRIPFFEGVE